MEGARWREGGVGVVRVYFFVLFFISLLLSVCWTCQAVVAGIVSSSRYMRVFVSIAQRVQYSRSSLIFINFCQSEFPTQTLIIRDTSPNSVIRDTSPNSSTQICQPQL